MTKKEYIIENCKIDEYDYFLYFTKLSDVQKACIVELVNGGFDVKDTCSKMYYHTSNAYMIAALTCLMKDNKHFIELQKLED